MRCTIVQQQNQAGPGRDRGAGPSGLAPRVRTCLTRATLAGSASSTTTVSQPRLGARRGRPGPRAAPPQPPPRPPAPGRAAAGPARILQPRRRRCWRRGGRRARRRARRTAAPAIVPGGQRRGDALLRRAQAAPFPPPSEPEQLHSTRDCGVSGELIRKQAAR